MQELRQQTVAQELEASSQKPPPRSSLLDVILTSSNSCHLLSFLAFQSSLPLSGRGNCSGSNPAGVTGMLAAAHWLLRTKCCPVHLPANMVQAVLQAELNLSPRRVVFDSIDALHKELEYLLTHQPQPSSFMESLQGSEQQADRCSTLMCTCLSTDSFIDQHSSCC